VWLRNAVAPRASDVSTTRFVHIVSHWETRSYTPSCGPSVAQNRKIRQFGACVSEAFGDMLLAPAFGDPLLEAVDLIDECSASRLDGTITVRVHGIGRYMPSGTQRDAPHNEETGC
jgi:hypothetical protein